MNYDENAYFYFASFVVLTHADYFTIHAIIITRAYKETYCPKLPYKISKISKGKT